MPHVVVVGGGVTGLTAAFRLSQRPGLEVTLLEAREGVGGKLNTVSLDGVRVELSADSFLPRDDRPLKLCRDIGIADELVEPVGFGGWLLRQGRMEPLPSGTVLGFPVSANAALRARVLSPVGRVRAAAEVLRRKPLQGPDVSVASFTRSRLGPEVLDRMVDPLLAGTRAGTVEEISLAAAVPPVDKAARTHGSVIRGLGRQTGAGARPAFFAPRTGMHRIVEALEDAMPEVHIKRGARVEAIRGAAGALEISAGGETMIASGAIVTTPASDAAQILGPLSADAGAALREIRFASSAVVNLIYPPGSLTLPTSGSGLLVPSSEATTVSGCTWYSRKWPHMAAADGRVTIRCFVGRGERDLALDLGDADLAGVVVEELRTILGATADPEAFKVTRWEGGMPIYEVGHLQRVARIEDALAPLPLLVAGASYRGSGIPDCITQAERAAEALLQKLRR